MQLNKIVTKLEQLLAELSELPHNGVLDGRPALSRDAEKMADRWVRKYVRNHKLVAPNPEVIRVLRVRTAYAIGFASLLPRQKLELSLERSVELVETLMIDLWHGCFRHKWLAQTPVQEEAAFAA
jgi:hypothetical protein